MPKHLLIVEDDGADLELARLALEVSEVRCELSVARDGQEALDFLRGAGDLPDLVLLDLNMPRVSGEQVIQAIKSNETLRHVPVVVFTTSNEAWDRTRARSAGADGYVLKPQHFEELIAALNALGQRWLTPVRQA